MSDLPHWTAATLASQLEFTPVTWAALQEHGVTEASSLALDFFYEAPGEDEAQALVAFLQAGTDYDVKADSTKTGKFFSKLEWAVNGTTQAQALTLLTLNEWVEWMVLAGAENGECKFDGWGAQVT
jgi:hypothetical protein